MSGTPINRLAVAIPVLTAAAAGIVWWGPWRLPQDADRGPPPLTADAIEQRRAELAESVTQRSPASHHQLDDLAAPLANILRACPGVVHVDVPLSRPTPRKRIVHFLDWHFVDRQLLAEVDGRTDWDTFLLEVEATQIDQAAAMEFLARHHGLKQVLVEGLTEADMPLLPDKIAHLREAEEHQPALKARLAETQQLLREFPKENERHKKAVALEREIERMRAEHKEEMLKVGAAIRLMLLGRLDAVLPLDDAKLLDAAGPVLPKGKQDPAAVARREQAMVKKALAAAEPVAVITCGASHDLTAAIRASDNDAEYYRVTVRGFEEAAGRR
jgi:hypothetical protein